jgi:hypothetical protein
MTSNSNIIGFDKIKLFSPGDLISFRTLKGEKILGILLKIYTKNIDNNPKRKCVFCTIHTSNNQIFNLVINCIHLEHKCSGFVS